MRAGLPAKVLSFGALPFFSLASTVLATPLINDLFGVRGFASIAVGQAVGGAVSVIASLDWPTEGPHRVSRAPADQRRSLFWLSCRQRSLCLAVILPVSIVATLFTRPAAPAAAAVAVAGTALNGLSPGWYFIGTGQAGALAWAEGLPRLAAGIAAIPLLLWTHELVLYPFALAVASAAGLALGARIVGRQNGTQAPHSYKRGAAYAAVARSVDSVGWNLLLPAVAVFSRETADVFAYGDRFIKLAYNALSAAPLALISWIGTAASLSERKRRLEICVWSTLIVGSAVASASWLALPTAANTLFSGRVVLASAYRAAIAVTLGLVFMYRSYCAVVLVPLGLEKLTYHSMLLVGFGGVGAVAMFAHDGAAATLIAFGAIVAAALLVQQWAVVRNLRQPPSLIALADAAPQGMD